MKTYLEFSTNGDVSELKTRNKLFNFNDYCNEYNSFKNITYNKYNFILLYNSNNNDINTDINNNNNNDINNDLNNKTLMKNISKLPFYNELIYGKFLLFTIDLPNNDDDCNNNTIVSFSEKKFLNLISVQKPTETCYSSDDFD